MHHDRSLELTGDQFRELVETALERLVPHLDTLADQPTWNSDEEECARPPAFEPLPSAGAPAKQLLDDLFERMIPPTYNTASPGYLAYIPGGGLPHVAVADLIADTINCYVGVWLAAPWLAWIEANVVRWFADIVGYSTSSGGFLTTGGSLANWSAMVTARRCRLPDDFLDAVIYTSDQSHHSVQKAAMLAGFPIDNVRLVGSDEHFRIDISHLQQLVETDRVAGLTPFAIVGNAGTTNTGAVDNLEELADVASQHGLWFHVDAAYGGFFMLTERGRRLMRGLDRADSITLDPHKGLFLPYGNGCLLVRDEQHLRHTFQADAHYLPARTGGEQRVDFCDISPELSRDFRGLRVWLPMKMHGLEPFRANLDEKLDLAAWITRELRTLDAELRDTLEVVAEPQLTVLTFRLRREGLDEFELTQLNREFWRRINADRRVFLTPTVIGDRFVIRICILSFRTHRERMDECLAAIRRAAQEVADLGFA